MVGQVPLDVDDNIGIELAVGESFSKWRCCGFGGKLAVWKILLEVDLPSLLIENVSNFLPELKYSRQDKSFTAAAPQN